MFSRFYLRSKNGVLENTPTVDNSYKWSGGGILSTAEDLIRMANHLSFIYMGWLDFDGVIKRSTLTRLWQVGAVPPDANWLPALGWFVARRSGLPVDQPNFDQPDRLYVVHTGGAVGGTTVLLLSLPHLNDSSDCPNKSNPLPPVDEIHRASQIGPICVAVLTNLQDVSGISQLGIALSELFLEYALHDESSSDVLQSSLAS